VDTETLCRYYKEIAPRLMVFLTQIKGLNRLDAEEVIQTTALDLWKMGQRIGTIRNLTAWSYTLARNKGVDILRRHNRDKSDIIPEDTPADGPTPEEQLLNQETRSAVQAFIGKQKPLDREILFLRFYQELTIMEIAAITERPAGSIKFRLSEIRRILRQDREVP
jgi:RNA polymerase sigma-70 factor (ECF subfamily)